MHCDSRKYRHTYQPTIHLKPQNHTQLVFLRLLLLHIIHTIGSNEIDLRTIMLYDARTMANVTQSQHISYSTKRQGKIPPNNHKWRWQPTHKNIFISIFILFNQLNALCAVRTQHNTHFTTNQWAYYVCSKLEIKSSEKK